MKTHHDRVDSRPLSSTYKSYNLDAISVIESNPAVLAMWDNFLIHFHGHGAPTHTQLFD